MKKMLLSALIASILCSQTGCVGDAGSAPANVSEQTDFPYATAEIKEKLAKRINPDLKTVPEDFFETFNYTSAEMDLDDLLAVLETEEQKQFWKALFFMRIAIIAKTLSESAGDDVLIELFKDKTIPPAIIADAIAYEESHPIHPDLTEIHKMLLFMSGMIGDELSMAFNNAFSSLSKALSSSDDMSGSEEDEADDVGGWNIQHTDKLFQLNRTEVLKTCKNVLKSGKTPQKYTEAQKAEADITKYTVYFRAPDLYPAELLAAEFTLDPKNNDLRYTLRPWDLINDSSVNTTQNEPEKPLPYKLDLLWYSIVENKVYSLKMDLPRALLAEKLMGGEDKPWNALLFTLTPHGRVTLYFYHQDTRKKEKLAEYQAKEETKDLHDLRKMALMIYELSNAPAKDWNHYQRKALKRHVQAAENLKHKGIPSKDDKNVNFWTTDADEQTDFPHATAEIKEKLSEYQAKEETLNDTPTPAQNWEQYQQQALGDHQNAAKNLQNNGLPAPKEPDVDYRTTDSSRPPADAINLPDAQGLTPLVRAIWKQDDPLFQRLIAARADVNLPAPASGETPLCAAASMGYTRFISALLSAGADVNARNSQSGRTPLMEAVWGGHTEAVRFLLERGANVNARVIMYGQRLNENALSLALNNNYTEIAQLLRQAGAEELSAANEPIPSDLQNAIEAASAAMDMSPFHIAIINRDMQKLQELISSGADLNVQAPLMGTPLLYACSIGNTQAARMLIEAKADVNLPNSTTGYTPLLMACQSGDKELVKLLIAAGADVNAKAVLNGKETDLTPLRAAQLGGFEEIVTLLQQAGAK